MRELAINAIEYKGTEKYMYMTSSENKFVTWIISSCFPAELVKLSRTVVAVSENP